MSSHQIQLKQRFRQTCLQVIREFFRVRDYCEVMTPIAAREVIIDAHINPWEVTAGESSKQQHFLHSSPEMQHKLLLARGMTSLFEIAHVFRADESGDRHHPEFLMLEWYGLEVDHHDQMQLVEELVRDIWSVANKWQRTYLYPGTKVKLSAERFRRLSYYELFHQTWGINPHQTTIEELANLTQRLKLQFPQSGMTEIDDWLNFLLTEYLEPNVIGLEPTFIYGYPISQAALARIKRDEHQQEVASRFELYLQRVELCNGYHEQQSANDLRLRMQAQNELRKKQGQTTLPYCEQLIEEMTLYFPNCAGVALGLDRLLMLAGGFNSLDEIVTITSH